MRPSQVSRTRPPHRSQRSRAVRGGELPAGLGGSDEHAAAEIIKLTAMTQCRIRPTPLPPRLDQHRAPLELRPPRPSNPVG